MSLETLTEPNLGYPLSSVSTELRRAIKALYEVWEQAENVQGKP